MCNALTLNFKFFFTVGPTLRAPPKNSNFYTNCAVNNRTFWVKYYIVKLLSGLLVFVLLLCLFVHIFAGICQKPFFQLLSINSFLNSCETSLPASFVPSIEPHSSPCPDGVAGVPFTSLHPITGPGEPPHVPLHFGDSAWTDLRSFWGCSPTSHIHDTCLFETEPVQSKHGKLSW